MIAAQEFEHGANPVLNWMADNLVVRANENGDLRPVKPENPNSPKKIDGVVAGIMAIDRMTATPGEDAAGVTAIGRCQCGELAIGKQDAKGAIVFDCGKHK
jgi:phage terminase large subunit-like protein